MKKDYCTVTNRASLERMYDHIKQHDILAVDTEATSLNVRKGRIVGWSVCGEVGESYYFPTLLWDNEKSVFEELEIDGVGAEKLSRNLMKTLKGKKLIFHNGGYDVPLIKNYYEIDLIDDLWLDTIMLVHTVQEEGAGMGVFGLKPLAISVQDQIGFDVEEQANKEQIELKESIKKNGGGTTKMNFEIYKADLDILSSYAAADTDLTFRLYLHFIKKLKEEKLEKFFFEEEVMPIYREVTIPMEERGIKLDIPLLEKAKKEIIEDLEKNKKVVIESLLKLDSAKEWVVDNSLKNHPPSHRGSWAQKLAERYSLPLPRSKKTQKYSISKKSLEELEDSPQKEFFLTGNIEALDPNEVVRISMALWKEKNEGDYINIQSKKHLGEIVFKYMRIKPRSKTDKGQSKFDMDMVEELSKDYEWAENLRIYNKLLKIKSTYIDRFLDKQENGRYYPYFKQHGTVSGRYGSDLQQLPKPKEEDEDVPIIIHYNNLVREFFIAGEGRKFIDDDYMSLEPRIFASLTADEGLKEIFKNNWDFYSTVAIKTEQLDRDKRRYPNGVSPDTNSPVYLKNIDTQKRNKAKTYSLGLAYGMSAYALAMNLSVSQKEAQVLYEGYLDGFPRLRDWIESSRDFAKIEGYIRNQVGRIRHLPKLRAIEEKYGSQIMNWRFRNQLAENYGKEQVLQLYRDYKNGLNNCLNFQIQSMAASVVNRAALQINRKAQRMGIDALVIAQIHDQLVIDIEKSKAEEFAPIVKEIMENTTKLDGVELIADPEIGDNMRETH